MGRPHLCFQGFVDENIRIMEAKLTSTKKSMSVLARGIGTVGKVSGARMEGLVWTDPSSGRFTSYTGPCGSLHGYETL